MDPVSIVTAVGAVGKTALDIAQTLYELTKQTKNIDQIVSDLATEVETLGETCESVHLQLSDIVRQYDLLLESAGQNARLWISTKTNLDKCQRTIDRLQVAIEPVRKQGSNILTQAVRAAKFSLDKPEIFDLKSRVRSHTTALHINLQVINITVSHLAPKYADQSLLTKLDLLQRKVDILVTQTQGENEPGPQKDDDLLQYAAEVLSSGASLYESSIAGGSVFSGSVFGGPSAKRKDSEQIPAWIRSVQGMSLDSPEARRTPTGSVSGPSVFSVADDRQTVTTENTSTLSDPDEVAEATGDWDDDFEIDVAKHALTLGREAFSENDFQTAHAHLESAHELTQQISRDHRQFYNKSEMQYMQAVCAFHIRSTDEAETALVAFLERPASSTKTEAVNLCHAGFLLAQVYVRMSKLDLARSSCHGVVRGRWKLLGDKHPQYFESLALLARIHELQGHQQKSLMYASMIPQDVRVEHVDQFACLGKLDGNLASAHKETSSSSARTLPRKFLPALPTGSNPSPRPRPPIPMPSKPPPPVPRPSAPVVVLPSSSVSEYYSQPLPVPAPLIATRSEPSFARSPSLPPYSLEPATHPTFSGQSLVPQASRSSSSPKTLTRAKLLEELDLKVSDEVQRAIVNSDPKKAIELAAAKGKRFGSSISGSRLNAIHVAALFGELEVVQVLIGSSNINEMCKIPYSLGRTATALHFAVAGRHEAVIRLLVAHGANLQSTRWKAKTGDSFEYSPPALLCLKSWLDLTNPSDSREIISTLQCLLSLGWKINGPVDSVSRTMLHLAARLPQDRYVNFRRTIVSFLLEVGANPLSHSLVNCIPLHFAARWNQTPETVQMLLNHKRLDQIDAVDKYGNTVLHDATWNRRDHGSKVSLSVLHTLLEAGARVDVKNKKGETPSSIAWTTTGRQQADDRGAIELLRLYQRGGRYLGSSGSELGGDAISELSGDYKAELDGLLKVELYGEPRAELDNDGKDQATELGSKAIYEMPA